MIEPGPTVAPGRAGAACTLCGDPAVVNWQRRLTPTEVADAQATEQSRRDQLLLLADPQLPPPDFGPLPDCADWTHAVYACTAHGITRDAATRIHEATCTAPQAADLPGCNCTPEPPPEAPPEQPGPELPAGW